MSYVDKTQDKAAIEANAVNNAVDRRRFLKISSLAAGTALASPGFFHYQTNLAHAAKVSGGSNAPLASWQDLYRQRWEWDEVIRGSHGWLNCRSACNWDLFVKDGVVVREEQTANYEASEPGVPDFNPRGCQKGACYTEVMYGPTRLTVPMKRAGERGEGKWQRISWDQALSEIAEKLVDISEKHGGSSIVHDLGPHFDLGATNASRNRFFGMMGAALPDDWAEIGDLNMGATLTFGMPHIGGSSDEWFMSDFLVVWMMNPNVTQIPDAHFLMEAKYNGAELTVIDPIYSATAIRADRWVPPRAGTDAALGLAVAKHIWDTDRINLDYVREQTDFPILVRLDNGQFLRESDMKRRGADNVVFMWDPKKNRPVVAPGCEGADGKAKIALKRGFEPPIEGQFQVTLESGEEVGVVTVGTLMREMLEEWTFERAAEVTEIDVELVKDFAEGFAAAQRPMILSSWGSNRFMHSDLMNRAKILCLSLKGAIGTDKGAGYHSTGWIDIAGFGAAVQDTGEGQWGKMKGLGRIFGDSYAFGMIVDKLAGRKSAFQVDTKLTKYFMNKVPTMTNSASQNYNHQGLADDLARETDHLYPRPLAAYVEESQQKAWMPVCPTPDQPPRAWITGGSNVLRRSNLPQRMLDHMWPGLELVVDLNQKNTFTGLHADYLLPAAGFYEKPGIKYSVAYIPYVHHCGQAVAPVGESKDEWEIFALLSAEVQRVARKRQTPKGEGCGGRPVDLQNIGDKFTKDGEWGPDAAHKVNDWIVDNSPALGGVSTDKLKEDGISKYANVGGMGIQENTYNSDWEGEGVLQALTDMTRHKWAYPTLTGRQQFYIDHEWFVEAGEALPTHKESPKAGGDHPFQFVSCHARHSVHSVWRDTPMMLRLQRGEPTVYLNPRDAKELGLDDNQWASITNDYDTIRMRVKLSTMVRPKIAYYFHAWEPYQFPDHKSYKWLIPGLMNPLHFAGGSGQLGWFFGHFEPGQHVQDTRVAIAPWNGEKEKI